MVSVQLRGGVPRALHGARGRAVPARVTATPTAAKQSQSNKQSKPGFKYDGAMQRWVRDDRLRMVRGLSSAPGRRAWPRRAACGSGDSIRSASLSGCWL
jgi:hypothetical protein